MAFVAPAFPVPETADFSEDLKKALHHAARQLLDAKMVYHRTDIRNYTVIENQNEREL